jgi:hypothetical protein
VADRFQIATRLMRKLDPQLREEGFGLLRPVAGVRWSACCA